MAKIGAGHARAWMRAGFKESGQALVALPTSNIRPVEEPGLYGNPTQGEVAEQKSDHSKMLDGYAQSAPDKGQEQGIEQ